MTTTLPKAPIKPAKRNPMKQGFVKRVPIENIMWQPENRRELAEGLATIVNSIPQPSWKWFWTNLTGDPSGNTATHLKEAVSNFGGGVDVHLSMFHGGAASFSPYYDQPFHEDYENEDDVLPPYLRDVRNSMIRRPDLPMSAVDKSKWGTSGIPQTTAELTALAYEYGNSVPQGQIASVWNRAYSLYGEALLQPAWAWDPTPMPHDPSYRDQAIMDSKIGPKGSKSLGHAVSNDAQIANDVIPSRWAEISQGNDVANHRFERYHTIKENQSGMSKRKSSQDVNKESQTIAKEIIQEMVHSKPNVTKTTTLNLHPKRTFEMKDAAACAILCHVSNKNVESINESIQSENSYLVAVDGMDSALRTITDDVSHIWWEETEYPGDSGGPPAEPVLPQSPEIITRLSSFGVLLTSILAPLVQAAIQTAIIDALRVVSECGMKKEDFTPMVDYIKSGEIFSDAIDGEDALTAELSCLFNGMDLPYSSTQLANQVCPVLIYGIQDFGDNLPANLLNQWGAKGSAGKKDMLANAINSI